MRRTFFSAIFTILAAALFPQDDIKNFVEEYLAGPELQPAVWSVSAAYADTGENIFNYNEKKSLSPGSNMKLITSAAALLGLGEDFRFETDLALYGEVSRGKLNGDLVIFGKGDPTVGSEFGGGGWGAAAAARLVNDWLKRLEANSVALDIIADQSAFYPYGIPYGWPWGELGSIYGAVPMPVNYHENVFVIQIFASGNSQKSRTAKIEPFFPDLEIDNNLAPGTGSDFVYSIFWPPFRDILTLSGTIPDDGALYSIRCADMKPGEALGHGIALELSALGADVKAKPSSIDESYIPEKPLLMETTLYSAPLSEILYYQNHRSVNLYAECICKAIGWKMFSNFGTEYGAAGIEEILRGAGLPVENSMIFDGSGLFLGNLVTTELICKLLVYMKNSPLSDAFYSSMAYAGDPQSISFYQDIGAGTILAGNLKLKTGTLEGVKAHSGYLTGAKSGRPIAFSIIMNHFTVPVIEIAAIHEELMLLIAENY